MATEEWKFPVTRHEELVSRTPNRQGTWDSFKTIVDHQNERSQNLAFQKTKERASLRWQGLRSRLVQTTSACQHWLSETNKTLSWLSRNWWLIELISWCLSAFCMVLIATLLAAWNGRPLPDHFPLGLKLNAYISVLAAVAKLALAVCLEEALATQKYLWYTTETPERSLLDFERFEVAARRPIGALKLIWHMRARSFASLGAIIFLLSLALDPFFQQLLSYPSRPSSRNPSTIPRLVTYQNPSQILESGGGVVTGQEIAMRTVVPTFFRGKESTVPLNVFCPSESCTWPEYETLAICSSCTDITSYLTHECLEESGTWRRDFNPEPPRTNLTRTRSCGWFFNATSEDPLLMTGYNLEGHGTVLSRHFPYHDTVQNDLYWGGSLLSKEVPQPIADFAAVSSPNFEAVHRNETPQAISCTLRWCVKRMTGRFSEGVLQEHVIATYTNDTQVPEPLSCWYEPDGSRQWQYDGNITLRPPNSTDTYFIEERTMLSARFSIDAYIPNIILQQNASATIVSHYPLPIELDGGPMTESVHNKFWLEPGGASQVVDRMSQLLTHALRNDLRFGQNVFGSGVFVTYIAVEWSFFAFPLMVLALTLGLLLATIVQTYRKDVWKTSDLTTLVHGLSEEAKMQLKDARSMQDVREVAKDMQVYLTANNDGRRQLDVSLERQKSSRVKGDPVK